MVNPHHVKNVPGREMEVKEARWLVQLLQHGLLKASFVPPEQECILSDLKRWRTSLLEERTRVVNQVQALLEDVNIKLGCVASDVMGISGRAIPNTFLIFRTVSMIVTALFRKKEAQT